MFGLFFPIVFSTGIYKLSLMVDSTIAARLETGEITVLSYASQISNIINTLLIGNLLTYYYPKIVRKTDTDNDQKSFWKQTILFHLIVCLVIAGFTNVAISAWDIYRGSSKTCLCWSVNIYYRTTDGSSS